jgi:hypothetical protein
MHRRSDVLAPACLIAILFAVAIPAVAQDGPNTNLTDGPPMVAYQKVFGYSGTNLTYICYARSVDQSRVNRAGVSISAASNAAAVSFTSNGHGFDASSRPKVTISGATGGWTSVNGTFTATITGANTFTIAVDSSAFGALTGTLVFKTTAPRTSIAEWAVKRYVYDGSNNLIFQGWDAGAPSLMQSTCAASTTSNLQ